MSEPDAKSMLGGHEPYDMDFGDTAYGEWLEQSLSSAELARRRWWFRLDCRMAYPRVVRWVTWPLRWVVLWQLTKFDVLCEERSGQSPPARDLSWKIRTEFGR